MNMVFSQPEWKVFFELLTVVNLMRKTQIMTVIERNLKKIENFSVVVEEMVYHLMWCLPLDYRRSFCDRNRSALRECGSVRIANSVAYIEVMS
jgi:hypothetical protein